MRPAVGFLHMVPGRWYRWHLQEDSAGAALSFTFEGQAAQIGNSQVENQEEGLMSARGRALHCSRKVFCCGGLGNTGAPGVPASDFCGCLPRSQRLR